MNVEANHLELIAIDLCLTEFHEAPVTGSEQIKPHGLAGREALPEAEGTLRDELRGTGL